jgi:hypothetical protein
MYDFLATMFFNTLTPKFYVALTGTSSLISGLILVKSFIKFYFSLLFVFIKKIFEWWYFKKYGTSFIEQVSLNYISSSSTSSTNTNTALTDTNCSNNNNNQLNNKKFDCDLNSQSLLVSSASNSSISSSIPECKVWKNPMSLFRGAEYSKVTASSGKDPLTFYDMNLSAQDHQTYFSCDLDEGKIDYEIMQRAWRERNQNTRVMLAREALEVNQDCTPAYILLAEEEATNILESEKLFKTAFKFAEIAYKKSLQAQEQGHSQESLHSNLIVLKINIFFTISSSSSSRKEYKYFYLC